MKRKVPMRLLSFLLAGAMMVSGVQMPVYAAEVEASGTQIADMDETIGEGDIEEKSVKETEGSDLSTEQTPDSAPENTETEDTAAADPGDFDAVSSEAAEPEKSEEAATPEEGEESAVPEEGGESIASEDIETPGSNEDAGAAANVDVEEEEEISGSEETPDAAANAIEGRSVTYRIVSQPTERTYLLGAKVNPAGAKLKVTEETSEGDETKTVEKTVDITSDMLGGYSVNADGIVNVPVKYDNQDTGYSIQVMFIKVPESGSISMSYGAQLSTAAPMPTCTYGTWSWMNGTQTPEKGGINRFALNFQPNDSQYESYTNILVDVKVTCSLANHAKVELVDPTVSYTYDGTQKTPDVKVQVGGITLNQGTDYTVEYGANVNAGTNSGTVKVIGDGTNYLGEKVFTFPIAKAKLKFTAKRMSIYYGDILALVPYEYETSGLGLESDLKTPPVFTCNISQSVGPGDYYIVKKTDAVLEDGAKDNYELPIEYEGNTLTISEFKPESIRIVGVIAVDKEYDNTPWKYSGTIEIRNGANNRVLGVSFAPTYSGTLRNGTKYPESGNVTSVAPKEAGDYTLTFEVTELEDPNRKPYEDPNRKKYVLEESTASYDFKIAQKEITIAAKPIMVKAGELVPAIEDLHDENGKALSDKYTVSGILSGDQQDKVLNLDELKLKYSVDEPSPENAGEFEIIPDGAKIRDKDDDDKDTNYTNNYKLVYENGKLTVEGRLKFEADFNSITAKDMTYSGKPHSISGSATGMETYRIVVIGNMRDERQKVDTGWVKGDDMEDPEGKNDDKYNYKQKREHVSPADIVSKYQEIAPTEVGDYTLKIFSEIDRRVYAYDGDPLPGALHFQILPLQKNEMKLVGVTGVTNKIYDGEVTDLTEAITNAKVWTKQDVDITDLLIKNKKLKFWIRGVKTEDSEEDKTEGSEGEETEDSPYKDKDYFLNTPIKDTMPSDAGEYELVVRVEADESENYVTNEWRIPFVIKQRPLTVTVENVKIPVNANGAMPDTTKYTYTITDDTITDEEKKILSNDDFAWLNIVIAPFGEVDTTVAGSYDLLASSDIAEADERKGNNYEITYVPGKLFVQTQLCGVKEFNLTNNRNIPHGTTLEDIADKYLPKTAVIYLDKDKIIEDKATIEWKTDKPSSGNYNMSATSVQNFKMKGTLVLPDLVYVTDENKKWLTVIVDISVREANDGTQALRPYANIKSGTVGPGTRVSLSTDEEGAEIYYTVEADNPSLSVASRRYTGPVEVNCTMVIRAVSRIYGKLDSEELYLYYYYNKNWNPGGSDDPYDPNNPQVPDDDVPKGEDGKPLEIPKGLWVTDVAQYTYTGKEIKPQVRVYDYKTRLEENKDYTISYKNNVKAADKNHPKKAPTIVIEGKGNYEGRLRKTFTIAPKNINDVHEENGHKVYDVKIDDITVAYVENKAQKPAVAASWNGVKLVNKKDYTFEALPNTAVGTYPVTVTGNGNYTGERKISFTITNAIPVSKLTVEKIANYNYTGQEIKPPVIVTYQKGVLQQGLEYTLSYEDNIEIGTASVVIKGSGRFAGVKRVNFKIKAAASLRDAQVKLEFNSGLVYTGKEITPSAIKLAVKVENNGAVETRVLTENDYKVTYRNNVNAGKATAVITGVGAYSGTLKETFNITRYNLQDLQPDQITVQSVYPFMKGGSKQKPAILFDGKTLKEGTDYTLSYKNNTKVGNTAIMTIRGIGNFKGSVIKTYQVTVRDISNMTVAAADKVFQAKMGNYKTKIQVLDSNGRALTAGKDYNKQVAYAFAERTVLSADVVKNAGDPISEFDMLPAGTKVRVTVTAIGSNFQGMAIGTFSIVHADVSKTRVAVPEMTYTGKPIEPKKTEISVTYKGLPLAAEDYRIVGYSNNLNKGTAKLTIQGQGNFGGTKTVTFKIKKKSLFAQLFG